MPAVCIPKPEVETSATALYIRWAAPDITQSDNLRIFSFKLYLITEGSQVVIYSGLAPNVSDPFTLVPLPMNTWKNFELATVNKNGREAGAMICPSKYSLMPLFVFKPQ